MVTANILRETWKGVVEAHRDGITFVSEWNPVLDYNADVPLPCCIWLPPTVNQTVEGSILATSFTLNLFFQDNHEQDRRTDTMIGVYERMQVIASVCFKRYRELYLDADNIYQGVDVSMYQVGAATYTAAFDEPGKQITGCRLTVTVASNKQECVDAYFA